MSGGQRRGELSPNWRGDDAGYAAWHRRVYARFGAPQLCDFCGDTEAGRYEWATRHEVVGWSLDRDAWARLCRKRHRSYDMNPEWQARITEGVRRYHANRRMAS